MAKRSNKPPAELHRWSIYRLRGTPAQYVGGVYAPDEAAAIKRAIEEFRIAPAQQSRLIARRSR